ncbi:15122_t:CDS:2 [Acaulospora morrowiae]|uniref:15122_t:CDS:1 n=1 Tax=Acaulospora morrowiae TaxID=94023 RepID=A0A9N9G3H3_9GLOM|nr:15122_t:CDS:2 [Acaulospora morrowiae]
MLIPPEQFGIVEKGLYRSDMLHASHFPFIKSLNLKTILILSPEVPTRAVTNFLEENNIKLIHLGLRVWKPNLGWRPVSEELVKDGLEMVLDISNYPILVICTSGIHETGTFIGCLRKLQNWNFSSIIIEYRCYAGNKARYVSEQFIELFDMDLITLPHNLAPWFIEQRKFWQQEEEQEDLTINNQAEEKKN